ncbi:hypothetical protein [Lunatimonas salinarum]|uniref:hypothetical protein n=1 Tax=Lunatimonas salinarum TaxID=1774590 RepID=UPI001ADF41DB|nr:hypothetical protein [Lunatimonas salinarum]
MTGSLDLNRLFSAKRSDADLDSDGNCVACDHTIREFQNFLASEDRFCGMMGGIQLKFFLTVFVLENEISEKNTYFQFLE